MKTRLLTRILLVAVLLNGCSKANVSPAPDFLQEVLPGTFLSNNPANLSVPTSGYMIYIVGETHGNRQTKQVFQSYLKTLYSGAGVRDVILEEDQAYQPDANAYVHGASDSLVEGLCLRTDILSQIREFNAALPEDQKVNVHLVDIDSPMPAIYKHIADLYEQLGPAADSIELPSQSDFKTGTPEQRVALVEDLQAAAADQPDVLNELETVDLSLQWYALGNRMDTGQASGLRSTFFPLREDVITKNIRFLIEQLDGKPALAFFGGAHGIKDLLATDVPPEQYKGWAERLVESGVPVFSILIEGFSGHGDWRGETFSYGEGVDQYQLADGSALVSLFEKYPQATMIFVDYTVEANGNIPTPPEFPQGRFSQAFDGLILFREFTPMEDACNE